MERINNGQYPNVHLVIIISICIVTQNTNKTIRSKNLYNT